jgi:hypothetical protein
MKAIPHASSPDITIMVMRIRRARWLVGAAFTLTIGIYLLNFAAAQQFLLSPRQDHWGQFGDFVGGLLNPLVALFAFYWLTESVRIQKQELSATRAALENAAMESVRTRRADRFASLYDEVNENAFGEDMETVGLWIDTVAHDAGIGRDSLTDDQLRIAYRQFIEQIRRDGGNTKRHPLERARRNVKTWYIKCLLFFRADDLEEDQLFALITQDRASLMLFVFSMTRGQTAAWKVAGGMAGTTASSDAIYFEPLDQLVSRKYGPFNASAAALTAQHEA